METRAQKRARVARFGSRWHCNGEVIHEEQFYIYLGVHITPDLKSDTHLNQLKYKVAYQKREAILVGVRSGTLPIRRAVFLWKQWVEPKYAYACALWVRRHDNRAMGLLNRIQKEGAEALLGINPQRPSATQSPPCALLNEAGLWSSHALHAAGLMRFLRLLLSRPRSSLIRRVWDCVESHRAIDAGPRWVNSTNTAIHQLRAEHQALHSLAALPNPMDRIQWKHLTNDVARAEMTAWTRTQTKKRGRVNAYIQIARERQHRSGVYGQFPAYLRIPGLGRQARHAIAAMRLQSNQFVVTHAAYRETAIYGPARPEYQTRTCVWPHCANPPPGLAEQPVDDALHIFFHCPHLEPASSQMRYRVDTLLGEVGGKLTDIGPTSLQVSFLLGSLVPPFLEIEGDRPGLYTRILRETAWFLGEVHYLRWIEPRERRQ